MALTTVDVAKAALNVTDSSQDGWFTYLVPAACAAVKAYCKRNLESAAYTEYASGKDTQPLALRQRPITTLTLTGTLTNTSPTVTGLSSTAALTVGLAVSGTGIPSPSVQPTTHTTVIASIDSATQITLSANATANGAQSLTFGTAISLDPGGYFGKGKSAFALATLLTEGLDWVGEYAPDGTIRSGNVLRLGGGIAGSTLNAIWPWEWRKGSLTARMPPVWPAGLGNIKAVYLAGLGSGPVAANGTLPEDLTAAANMVVGYLRRSLPQGGAVENEALGQYNYTLAGRLGLQQAPELGEARQLLSRYREVVI